MTRTLRYRAHLSASLLAVAGGLIGCSSSGYSSGSSWDGLSQAEQAAAQAGIDQVERIYNHDPIEVRQRSHRGGGASLSRSTRRTR